MCQHRATERPSPEPGTAEGTVEETTNLGLYRLNLDGFALRSECDNILRRDGAFLGDPGLEVVEARDGRACQFSRQ